MATEELCPVDFVWVNADTIARRWIKVIDADGKVRNELCPSWHHEETGEVCYASPMNEDLWRKLRDWAATAESYEERGA